ncbi:hypothetical protein HUJ04_008288 [Dendroctonus ponderosae]|nr:hypothetical protein HUJ04_008288 [Dendroctonus ponderosae]
MFIFPASKRPTHTKSMDKVGTKHCYSSKKIKFQGQGTAQNSEKTVSQSQPVTHRPDHIKENIGDGCYCCSRQFLFILTFFHLPYKTLLLHENKISRFVEISKYHVELALTSIVGEPCYFKSHQLGDAKRASEAFPGHR